MANTYSVEFELSSSQYAARADTASLSQTGDITIEAWIKLEQLPSTPGTRFGIVSKFLDDAVDKRSYRFAVSAADKLEVTWSADGTSSNIAVWSADNAFVAGDVGEWRHVAAVVTVATETAVLYIGGSSIAATKTSDVGTATSIHDNDSQFAIGAGKNTSTTATELFDGLIDEARLWSVAQSADSLLGNYRKELLGTETNLQGYWKLNNDYNDSTVNANNLTASGSPVFSTNVPFSGESGLDLTSKIW